MGNFDRGQRGGGGRSFGHKSFGGSRGFDRPREMTKVTCSNCGRETEVPFKPTGDRPVYCRDCFAKMGGGEKRSFGGDRDSRPPFKGEERQRPGSNLQLEQINAKLDRLIELLSPKEKVEKETPAPEEKKIESLVAAAKKEAVVKKKKTLKKAPEAPEEV